MTRYAHIYGGKVQEIRETEMSWIDWCSIWDPSVFWLDVTGVPNVKVGSIVNFHPERGTYFENPPAESTYEDKSFDSKKSGKLELVSTIFHSTMERAYVDSSLGFRADAGPSSIDAISGLVTLTENDPEKEINFCDFDNFFHNVNHVELKALQNEVLQNRTYLREQKWAIQQKIENAETELELESIEIDFKMMRFSLTNYRG